MAYDVAFQTKVFPILQAAITTALASVAGGRIYWRQTASDTYPQVIVQPQAPGSRSDYLGANGWRGPLTFRVLSLDPTTADTILASIPALVRSLSSGGHSIDILFDRPVLGLPWEDTPAGRLYTSAAMAAVVVS